MVSTAHLLVEVVEGVGGDAFVVEGVGGGDAFGLGCSEEEEQEAPGDDELVSEGGGLHESDGVGDDGVAEDERGPDHEAEGATAAGTTAGAEEDQHGEQLRATRISTRARRPAGLATHAVAAPVVFRAEKCFCI